MNMVKKKKEEERKKTCSDKGVNHHKPFEQYIKCHSWRISTYPPLTVHIVKMSHTRCVYVNVGSEFISKPTLPKKKKNSSFINNRAIGKGVQSLHHILV